AADFGEFAAGEEFSGHGDRVDLGFAVAAVHGEDGAVDDLVVLLVEVLVAGEGSVDGVDGGEVEEHGAEAGPFGFEVVGGCRFVGDGVGLPQGLGHAAWPFLVLGWQSGQGWTRRRPLSSSVSRSRLSGSQSMWPQCGGLPFSCCGWALAAGGRPLQPRTK